MSDVGLDLASILVRRHEGRVVRNGRHRVYDDANGREILPGTVVIGHPTLGIGRCSDRKGLSEAEADYLFRNDLDDAQADALQFVGVEAWAQLNDVRRAVLISAAHQLGRAGLMRFKRTRAAVRLGYYTAAAAEMLDSAAARQTPARWSELAEMMRTGEVASEA